MSKSDSLVDAPRRTSSEQYQFNEIRTGASEHSCREAYDSMGRCFAEKSGTIFRESSDRGNEVQSSGNGPRSLEQLGFPSLELTSSGIKGGDARLSLASSRDAAVDGGIELANFGAAGRSAGDTRRLSQAELDRLTGRDGKKLTRAADGTLMTGGTSMMISGEKGGEPVKVKVGPDGRLMAGEKPLVGPNGEPLTFKEKESLRERPGGGDGRGRHPGRGGGGRRRRARAKRGGRRRRKVKRRGKKRRGRSARTGSPRNSNTGEGEVVVGTKPSEIVPKPGIPARPIISSPLLQV